MALISDPALVFAGGGMYFNLPRYTKLLTRKDRYGGSIKLYLEVGKYIFVPRNYCSIASHTDIRLDDGVKVNFVSSVTPRNQQQQEVMGQCSSLLDCGKSFILEAYTGFGKTIVGVHCIAEVGRRTLIVVHKKHLLYRWAEDCKTFLGLDDSQIGFCYADHLPSPSDSVVIGLIQSLSDLNKYSGSGMLDGFGLVLFDEVHRMPADKFNQACYQLPARLRIGLSATPERKDGRGILLRGHIGKVEVIARKNPLVPKVIIQDTGWKMPLRKVQEEGMTVLKPIPHDIGKTMHLDKILAKNKRRNFYIARFTKTAYEKGRRNIVFSSLKSHLTLLHDIFVGQNIPTEDIGFWWGDLVNEAEMEEQKTKRVLLATYAYAAEALDIPGLDTCVLATPRSDIKQVIGRILRELPGKKIPVVFDLRDDSSAVFQKYGQMRDRYYCMIGAERVCK